ncbi:hypothetical protein KDN32_09445 [Nocardioides sp. J2M5]|uniref:hypothetical protein n=1 Tax=Nocardioides TaxID=1839 RepID=UPI001BAD8449|nr:MULTISPECIES: hypothetical protein [Nocardioides]MBS2937963.1 hypothetical protein [Nocardioides palaemonis]
MTSTPSWRRTYDVAERAVAPHAERWVRSGEYAQVTAAALGVRRRIGRVLDSVATTGWHLVNLPARSDVQKLRRQIGALDRDLRRLSLQLEQSRTDREGSGQ